MIYAKQSVSSLKISKTAAITALGGLTQKKIWFDSFDCYIATRFFFPSIIILEDMTTTMNGQR